MSTAEEKQLQRTFLRERFLRLVASAAGMPTEIVLYNNNTVKAKFSVSDVDILQFQVSDLHTPIGIQPHAILRTTDIISMTFDRSTPWDFKTEAFLSV